MKKKVSTIVFVIVMALSLCAVPLAGGCAAGEIVYELSADGDHYYVYGSRSNVTDEQLYSICPYYSESLGPVSEPTEDSLPVTSIAACGFLGNTKLKNVVIPDFITNIGASAFAYCITIDTFKFPDNEDFKTIPYGIFGDDNSLFYVDIPDTVERIEDYAFYMSHLVDVTIPVSVTYMGTGVFYRDEYLTTVKIYAQIDTLPYATFCSCVKLKDVTLSGTIREIKGHEYINGNDEVISEDDIIGSRLGDTDETKADPNYEDNVRETVPAFYYDYLEAGSDTILFDYQVETLYYIGTEEELNQVVIGEYNVCLTESEVLTVYCLENDSWVEVNWRF